MKRLRRVLVLHGGEWRPERLPADQLEPLPLSCFSGPGKPRAQAAVLDWAIGCADRGNTPARRRDTGALVEVLA